MTLVSLRSSYIVFVLNYTLSMFTKVFVYSTHLQPHLLFECLDGTSPSSSVQICVPAE
ncbi:hypothetical protein BDR03DRAFT_967592, partial [Suillus americanus]